METLQDAIEKKVKNIKNSKILGMPLFETPDTIEDISLPKELNP